MDATDFSFCRVCFLPVQNLWTASPPRSHHDPPPPHLSYDLDIKMMVILSTLAVIRQGFGIVGDFESPQNSASPINESSKSGSKCGQHPPPQKGSKVKILHKISLVYEASNENSAQKVQNLSRGTNSRTRACPRLAAHRPPPTLSGSGRQDDEGMAATWIPSGSREVSPASRRGPGPRKKQRPSSCA